MPKEYTAVFMFYFAKVQETLSIKGCINVLGCPLLLGTPTGSGRIRVPVNLSTSHEKNPPIYNALHFFCNGAWSCVFWLPNPWSDAELSLVPRLYVQRK